MKKPRRPRKDKKRMQKDGRWPMWDAYRSAAMFEYTMWKYHPEEMREAQEQGKLREKLLASAIAGEKAGEALRDMIIIDHQPAYTEKVLHTASMLCSTYPKIELDAAIAFLKTGYKAGVSSLVEIAKAFSELKTTES